MQTSERGCQETARCSYSRHLKLSSMELSKHAYQANPCLLTPTSTHLPFPSPHNPPTSSPQNALCHSHRPCHSLLLQSACTPQGSSPCRPTFQVASPGAMTHHAAARNFSAEERKWKRCIDRVKTHRIAENY